MRSIAVAVLLAASSGWAGEQLLQNDHFTSGGVNAGVQFNEYEGAGVLLRPDGGYPLTIKAVDVLVVRGGSSGSGVGSYFVDLWDESADASVSPPPTTYGNRHSSSNQGYQLTASSSQFNRVMFSPPVVVESGAIFIGVREMLSTADDGTTVALDSFPSESGSNWFWDPNGGWSLEPDGGARVTTTNNWIIRAVLSTPDVAPVVTAVSPARATNDVAVHLTITGQNFELTSVAKLGSQALATTSIVPPSTIEADVPAGFPTGVYDVHVTNTSNLSGTLPHGFTLLEADGGLPDSGTGGAGGGMGGGTGGGGSSHVTGPTIDSVSPQQVFRDADATITVVGTNFADGATVLLGNQALDTTRKSAAVLTAVVPKSFAVGTYDVTVINADGQRATKSQALTVGDKLKAGCGCQQGAGELALLSGAGLLVLFAARRRTRS